MEVTKYADTIKIIEDVASKNKVDQIDCASYFKSLDDKSRAAYFTDIAHFSDEENEKMAEIIYSALLKKVYCSKRKRRENK